MFIMKRSICMQLPPLFNKLRSLIDVIEHCVTPKFHFPKDIGDTGIFMKWDNAR